VSKYVWRDFFVQDVLPNLPSPLPVGLALDVNDGFFRIHVPLLDGSPRPFLPLEGDQPVPKVHVGRRYLKYLGNPCADLSEYLKKKLLLTVRGFSNHLLCFVHGDVLEFPGPRSLEITVHSLGKLFHKKPFLYVMGNRTWNGYNSSEIRLNYKAQGTGNSPQGRKFVTLSDNVTLAISKLST